MLIEIDIDLDFQIGKVDVSRVKPYRPGSKGTRLAKDIPSK